MSAGTRLFIEPLVETGRVGCRINLALGEVYVHVEHDGNPFVVHTAYGRAIITGTTFDVKASETAVTLTVVEGGVHFESGSGVVQVAAGQQSTIAGDRMPPSTPTSCDALPLTAWAHPYNQHPETIPGVGPQGISLDDLPAIPSPETQAETDLDRIDAAQWIALKQDWFRQQFPWIFAIQESLGREGIDVSYPDLLLRSGTLWLFEYPGLGPGRQVEPDPNGLLRAISYYGRDERWAQQQALLPTRSLRHEKSATGAAAFTRWADALNDEMRRAAASPEKPPLFASLEACTYLINIRTLAALAVTQSRPAVAPETREEILGLLDSQLRALAACVRPLYELSMQEPQVDPCECSDRVNRLIDTILYIGVLEKRVTQIGSEFL